jgi:DNA helicase-2/ATP-dependent DNA helicase PcrA
VDDDFLADLNDAQRRAVTTDAAPLCIIAGAGSGKTRVLTRRIAYRCGAGHADPRHVLALTFTRKAAGELVTRLRRLGLRDTVTAGTFHAIAYAQLRRTWADQGSQPPALLDRKVPLLVKLLPRRTPGTTGPTAADVASEIEWAKARLVSPADYPTAAALAGRRPPFGADEMGRLYQRYEDEKRNTGQVDFDDLLIRCARAVEQDPEMAAAQRWRFRHLFVDEFQDVNPLQFRLLQAWRGGSDDLCVVGDPNQAIYAWNGADPELLANARTTFPGVEVVELDVNYRSSPQIIGAANVMLGRVSTGVHLRPTRVDGPAPTIDAYPDEGREASAIARAVRDRQAPGVPWSHQAVLVRTHAQTVQLEEAFHQARIPFRVRGATPFTQLPEIRQALRDLQRSRVPLRDALAGLESGLVPPPDEGVGSDLDDDAMPAEWAGDDSSAGEPQAPRPTDLSDAEAVRVANLLELLRLGGEYVEGERDPTVHGFGSWLAATVRADHGDTGDAVTIATLHAAKGLEWPIVHIAGVEAGLVPISHARTDGARAEERRLFYVGITRAERELRLSWAAERTFGSRTSSRTRSPFLDELEPWLVALADGEAPENWREHLRASRHALGGTGRRGRAPRAPGVAVLDDPVALELLADLKVWRTQRARAADVPAYIVFNDRTLEEVARAQPDSLVALRSVQGIGPVKVERYGAELLGIVARHATTANG